MKTVFTFAFIMLLTACSVESEPISFTQKKSETTKADEPAAPAKAAPQVSAASPVQAEKPSRQVYGMADLPLCNSNAEGWIVYVQVEHSLLACLNGEWEPVDIRGAKGDTGVKGEAGAKGIDGQAGVKGDIGEQGIEGVAGVKGDTGAKGDTGETGAQGIQGEPGLGAIPGVGLYWTDPDSLQVWIIVSKKAALSGATCPTGFTLPTYIDRLPAKFHNYFSAFEATIPNNAWFWTSTVSGGRWITALNADTTMVNTGGANSQYMVICHN